MIQFSCKSDKGKRRTKNEDSYYVLEHENIYIVADGVGGNNAGEIASKMAVEGLADSFKKILASDFHSKQIVDYINLCIERVNKSIYDKSFSKSEYFGMATTVVIAWIYKGKAYIVNIGDSRCYIFRNGALKQVTEDHTYVNSLLKEGKITKAESIDHKDMHMITKALGAEENVKADIYEVIIKENDTILLCSDGLYGEVEEKEIISSLNEKKEMKELVDELVYKANQNGGKDNITALCLKVRGSIDE